MVYIRDHTEVEEGEVTMDTSSASDEDFFSTMKPKNADELDGYLACSSEKYGSSTLLSCAQETLYQDKHCTTSICSLCAIVQLCRADLHKQKSKTGDQKL